MMRLSDTSCCVPLKIVALIFASLDIIITTTVMIFCFFLSYQQAQDPELEHQATALAIIGGLCVVATLYHILHFISIIRRYLWALRMWVILKVIKLCSTVFWLLLHVTLLLHYSHDLQRLALIIPIAIVSGIIWYYRILVVNSLYLDYKEQRLINEKC